MKYKNQWIASPKCSVCQALKGKANHWWHVDIGTDGIVAPTIAPDLSLNSVNAYTDWWDSGEDRATVSDTLI